MHSPLRPPGDQGGSVPQLDCTAVVFAHNAVARIGVLVEGLRALVNEVVVCDIGSSDGTAETASQAGATVITREWVPVVEMLRQDVIDSVHARWILILDDDEVPDRRLLRSMAAVIETDSADVVGVCRLSYFFGAELRHAGYQPSNDNQIRLFKKGMLHAATRVHRKMEPTGGARLVRLDPDDGYLHHFSYESVSQWLEKVNRYTDAEAEWLAANVIGRRLPSLRFAARVLVEPVSLILRYRALNGGWRGRTMIVFMLNYRITSWAKAKALAEGHGPEATRASYLRLASELLAGNDRG